MASGARGFLLKEADPREFVTAIKAVASGRRYVDARVSRDVHRSERLIHISDIGSLSDRETAVVRLIGNLGDVYTSQARYADAEAQYQHALDMAQKLSHQLRAAEARIAELEAEGQSYQERAERAEQWLHRVYSEIQDRFLKRDEQRAAVSGAPRRKS